jgi:hypothetical protein
MEAKKSLRVIESTMTGKCSNDHLRVELMRKDVRSICKTVRVAVALLSQYRMTFGDEGIFIEPKRGEYLTPQKFIDEIWSGSDE